VVTVDTHSPVFRFSATVLGTPDPRGLAEFYGELLEWEIREPGSDRVRIGPPGDEPRLAFQLETEHVPPVWPAGRSDQQMQLHLDIRVDDLEAGVRRALALGAGLASYQPLQDVRVLLDPDGHPFCLVTASRT
jgi:catechol 2,3-dioxygenase-like lactoylglutathione lyase family enzyme